MSHIIKTQLEKLYYFFHILGDNISVVQIIGGNIGFTASVRLVNEHMSNSTQLGYNPIQSFHELYYYSPVQPATFHYITMVIVKIATRGTEVRMNNIASQLFLLLVIVLCAMLQSLQFYQGVGYLGTVIQYVLVMILYKQYSSFLHMKMDFISLCYPYVLELIMIQYQRSLNRDQHKQHIMAIPHSIEW